MKEFVVHWTNNWIGVDVDAEFFEKEVDVGVELWFATLTQQYEYFASILDKMLKGIWWF